MKTAFKISWVTILVLLLTVFLGMCSAQALTDGEYEFVVEQDGASIMGYTGVGGDVVVPSTLNDGTKTLPVTGISSEAFEKNTTLTSITIPEGVTWLSSWAFRDCTQLTRVSLPSTLTLIGGRAFAGCTSLTSISIPDACVTMGQNMFEGCTALKTARFGTGMKEVPPYTFKNCSALTSFEYSSNVSTIGWYAFENCKSLASIQLLEGVKTLGDHAFMNCTALTNLSFPMTLTTIADYAFMGCNIDWVEVPGDAFVFSSLFVIDCSSYTNVFTKIRIRSDATYIADKMFLNGLRIKEVDIPAGVTRIGERAFSGCLSIPSINLPSSVTQIGAYAFYDCRVIKSFTLPNGLKELGNGVFSSCAELTSLAIPQGVTSIGEGMFANCNKLESVSLPTSMTSVPSFFYQNCYALRQASIPSGATSIGRYALANSAITNVSIPASVTAIEEYAFKGCTQLTSVSLPTGLKTLGTNVFEGCSAMTSANMSAPAITTLPVRTFYGCTKLATVQLPPALTDIGSFAFYDCSVLDGLSIPQTLKVVGSSAFYRCYKLSALNIPSTVTNIWESAFKGCSALSEFTWPTSCPGILKSTFSSSGIKRVTLSNAVTEISEYAFENCSRLESIVLPATVKRLDISAFYGCTSLRDMVIPDGITSIPEDALSKCKLDSLVLPSSVTSVHAEAFDMDATIKSLTLPGHLVPSTFLTSKQLAQVTSITFTPGSTSLPAEVCQGMTALASVNIPSSVTSVTGKMFTGCYAITKVTLPYSVVLKNVFPSYASINEVKLASGTTSIVANAFAGCAELQTITLPDAVTSVGDRAFDGCVKLSSVIVPKSVSSIGLNAFSGCANVKLYGYAYSYAETYAKANSIPFVLLDGGLTLVVEGPATLTKGDAARYTAARLDGTQSSYVWSSTVPQVATIDQNGNLRAVGGGETQIMARDQSNSALFATLKLTVADPVTAIVLSPATHELQMGEVLDVVATLTPSTATNPLLTYASSHPTLASVSSDGRVKGLAIGTVTITARADNGVTGTMTVTVVPPTSSIRVVTLDEQSVNADVEITKTLALRALSYPAGTAVDVNWTSSDSATVSVSTNGLVKGLKAGTSDITASLKSDSSVKHSISIRVMVPVAEVKFNKASLEFETGDEGQLIASVLPLNATEPELTWASSQPSVVLVGADGALTAVGVGTATITATAKNKVFASCVITVADPEGTGDGGDSPDNPGGGTGGGTGSITISSDLGNGKAQLYAKQKLQLSASVAGVKWKSSAPSVVSVSPYGLITPKKAGKSATITAEIGSLIGTFQVDVIKKPTSIKLDAVTAYTNGPAVQLQYKLAPKGAVAKAVTWSVAGDAASITSTGKLTAHRDGTVTVTATLDTGKSARRSIQIKTLPSSVKLSVNEAVLKPKAKLKLTVTMDGTEPSVKWITSDKKIASVSKVGIVKALKPGTATITCTTANGLTAVCTIEVTKTPPVQAPTPETLQAAPDEAV